jgi:His/Glu/Gln/Arg/opine family amino acid ABC transporter permease subunit
MRSAGVCGKFERMMSALPRDWMKLAWYACAVAALLLGIWSARDFGWQVVWDASPFLLRGLGVSWLLAISSVVIGMVAGIILAAARLYGIWGVRHAAVVYIEIIRAVPQIMVIFWVYFTMPVLTGAAMNAWPACILALSMIAAAYLSEVIRAGLVSVPQIHAESAYSAGLDRVATFIHIVLPQALRNMLPALIATFIMMFKLTSVVYIIGLIDFFRAIILVNNRDFAPYALYLTAGVVYFACNYSLSLVIRRFDPKYTLAA